jgi:hypothetical protein
MEATSSQMSGAMKSKAYPEAVMCAAWGRVKPPSERTLAIIKKTYPVQARTSKECFIRAAVGRKSPDTIRSWSTAWPHLTSVADGSNFFSNVRRKIHDQGSEHRGSLRRFNSNSTLI